MNVPRFMKASAALVLFPTAGLVAAQPVTHMGERAIKRAEVATFVGEQFAVADTDRDGAVTKSELQSFRASLHTQDRATFDEIAAQSFDHADIDANGEIERWEADRRATQIFDMVDVDQNGTASIQEQSAAKALINLDENEVQGLLERFN